MAAAKRAKNGAGGPDASSTSNGDKPAFAYGTVTKEGVVEAARALVEREGFHRLTMRRLADDMGLSYTVAYYYVTNKRELVDLVLASIYARIEYTVDPDGTWRDRTLGLYAAAFRELSRYSGVAEELLSRRPGDTLLLLELSLEQGLRDEGFIDSEIRDFVEVTAIYVAGSVSWAEGFSARVSETEKPGAAVFADAEASPEDRFARGFNLMLDGLEVARDRRIATKGRRASKRAASK